jgi:hypothetical protein
MAFSESPAITVKEIDASGVVPNVSSSTGGIVGQYRWGPMNQATLVSNEASLVEKFGTPSPTTSVDFHSAAFFLKYTNALQVVRVGDAAAVNGYNEDSAANGLTPQITDADNFDNQQATLDTAKHTFMARWPGSLGNSLAVSICPDGDSAGVFNNWAYANSFDAAPDTSVHASGLGASNDEVHVAVIDSDGEFTGTRGTVLETFAFTSVASDAKNADGSTNNIQDVINRQSQYIWMAGYPLVLSEANAGTAAANGKDYQMSGGGATKNYSMTNGADGAVGTAQILAGFDKLEDKDQIQVDFLICPDTASQTDNVTVVNDITGIAQGTRKDCVAVASPARANVVGASTPVTSSVTNTNLYTNSSYLVVDNNYLKVYDKYNDNFITIPAASSTAGIMAATDANAAAWFSPGGPRRGQYLGVTGIAYSPNKSERDVLYRAGVNPIANIPGQGLLLFGDKTKLNRPSAFDRINVRRLFLVIERAIALAARNVMFEFNDEFTRAEFTGIVEPFLREVKGRRGITDFRVICDETNNTSSVVDRNEFVATILVKPARSINFVTLNFVAVRSGVDFTEVAGTV